MSCRSVQARHPFCVTGMLWKYQQNPCHTMESVDRKQKEVLAGGSQSHQGPDWWCGLGQEQWGREVRSHQSLQVESPRRVRTWVGSVREVPRLHVCLCAAVSTWGRRCRLVGVGAFSARCAGVVLGRKSSSSSLLLLGVFLLPFHCCAAASC